MLTEKGSSWKRLTLPANVTLVSHLGEEPAQARADKLGNRCLETENTHELNFNLGSWVKKKLTCQVL